MVNLVVEPGEIVGLLGPNGAGKTTTFYSIVGFAAADAGHIFLDGVDITGLPMYRRALQGIGYLPQETSIFRKLSVEQNIRAVLETRGLGKDELASRLAQLLKELNLEARAAQARRRALGWRNTAGGDCPSTGDPTAIHAPGRAICRH